MTQINDIITTLSEAKTAMEENPALKARIDSLLQQVYALEEAKTNLEAKHTQLHLNHDEACIKVTELEASLEAARFREQSSRKTLDKLVFSLRQGINEIDPQPQLDLSLVAEPEPMGIITQLEGELKAESQPIADTAEAFGSKPDSQPYLGRPFSFKPNAVSWRSWVEGGGNRPWWLTDTELDKIEPKTEAVYNYGTA